MGDYGKTANKAVLFQIFSFFQTAEQTPPHGHPDTDTNYINMREGLIMCYLIDSIQPAFSVNTLYVYIILYKKNSYLN